MPGNPIIRSATEADFPFVLSLNEKDVDVLSPMNGEKASFFLREAAVFTVLELDGKRAGFLIALDEGSDSYKSENYLWFRAHYSRFLYVDRIVVDSAFRGRGAGKRLYGAVFEFAEKNGFPYVTAEIDTVPPNPASMAFHKAMGFKEAGTQWVRGHTVCVSLQEKEITLPEKA